MADFFKVMELKIKYIESLPSGYKLPEWYIETFRREIPSFAAIETAEKKLLAWAAEHPDATEQKEGKPVESKRTRVHELLGVELDIPFVKQYGPSGRYWYVLTKDGVLWNWNGREKTTEAGSSVIISLIEHPENIFRRHTLTDEQREVLVWLQKGKFTHVSIDPDKEMTAYDEQPYKQSGGWFASQDDYSGVFGKAIECLRPLIPDWTQPLDIEKTLKEAGVL